MPEPTDRAARAERARLAHLAPLRCPPFDERDRDRGLERAWEEHLVGSTLERSSSWIALGIEGDYSLAAQGTREVGRWSVWSNVGRACLMLAPSSGSTYGYVITRREDGCVGLNADRYEVVASSAASAARASMRPISRASSGLRRA